MFPIDKSVQEEINDVRMGRPHVVLLGAGASKAAFRQVEGSGRRLPVMADFMNVVPVGEILEGAGIAWEGRNFEELYDEIVGNSIYDVVRGKLESKIREYFAAMTLPATATLYDALVLSLRPKDFIATFNWDPFLIQALVRNRRFGAYPRLLFLHGNVLQGYCAEDNVHGMLGQTCSSCGKPFGSVPLLYPVTDKDYTAEPAIKSAWDAAGWAFENAFMVTVFGYGAPASDKAAFALLQQAWGSTNQRELEQFEIIDIRGEAELRVAWSSFIHTHHYEVHSDFFESWIADHPRRTGEAYISQYLEARFIESNPLPREVELNKLQKWFEPLVEVDAGAAGAT